MLVALAIQGMPDGQQGRVGVARCRSSTHILLRGHRDSPQLGASRTTNRLPKNTPRCGPPWHTYEHAADYYPELALTSALL